MYGNPSVSGHTGDLDEHVHCHKDHADCEEQQQGGPETSRPPAHQNPILERSMIVPCKAPTALQYIACCAMAWSRLAQTDCCHLLTLQATKIAV